MSRRRKIIKNDITPRDEDKFNVYTLKNNFKFCSELLILGGLLKKYPKEVKEHYFENKGRFEGLIEFCKEK